MEDTLFSQAGSRFSARPPQFWCLRLALSVVLRLVAVIFALTLKPLLALSQNLPPPLSSGTASCSLFNAASRMRGEDTSYTQVISWVQGFIAAYDEYNEDGPIIPNGTADGFLATWLDTYCRSNPQTNIHDAATALATELEIRMLTSGQYLTLSRGKSGP